jgi:hypothetical protein
MSTLTITLSCLCVIFACVAFYSIYLNYRLGVIILGFQDSIEESLEIIDSKYSRMSKILEMPIFFDSVEVRQVVSDIKDTRDSLLRVANKLTENSKENSLEINDG